MSDVTSETVTEKKKPGPKPREDAPPGVEAQRAIQPAKDEKNGIPVRVLKIKHGQGIDIPGRVGFNTATSVPEHFGTSQGHWVITYKPWMRHHHVVYHPPGARPGKVEEAMLHESMCGWEPM